MQSSASSIEDAASIPVVAPIENFIVIRNFHFDRCGFAKPVTSPPKAHTLGGSPRKPRAPVGEPFRRLYCFCRSNVPFALQFVLLSLNRNVPDISIVATTAAVQWCPFVW